VRALLLVVTLLGCRPTLPPASPSRSSVVPIERDGRYVFTFDDLSFEVDPRRGARIAAFTIDGRNFLSGPEVDAENHGSTFWTSPQSDWDWPPVVEIDAGPYIGAVSDGVLSLTSACSARLGVQVTKRFSAAAGGAVSLEYGIRNCGAQARKFAPWEITRVRAEGVTFFPSGEGEYGSGPFAPLGGVRRGGGYTWFEFDPASPGPPDQELFADGKRGWLAHAERGAVLVKVFADVPAAARAPKESEIELYLHADARPAARYAEIEQQGPYWAIAPNETSTWRVTWYLKRLPPTARISSGDQGLVDFVESLAGTGR
jgi:hypothetical protein